MEIFGRELVRSSSELLQYFSALKANSPLERGEERDAFIQLTRNTFCSPNWLVELVLDEAPVLSDASPDAKLLRIEATGNVFVGKMLFRLSQNQKASPILRSPAAETFLTSQLVWKGERNLYAIDGAYLNVFVTKEGYQNTEKATTTLAPWREFWGMGEQDSL